MAKFISKYFLPFDLIPDIEMKIIRDYGDWVSKINPWNQIQQILAVSK